MKELSPDVEAGKLPDIPSTSQIGGVLSPQLSGRNVITNKIKQTVKGGPINTAFSATSHNLKRHSMGMGPIDKVKQKMLQS